MNSVPFDELLQVARVSLSNDLEADDGAAWSPVVSIGRGDVAKAHKVSFVVEPRRTEFLEFALATEAGEPLGERDDVPTFAVLLARRTRNTLEPSVEGEVPITLVRYVGKTAKTLELPLVVPYELTTSRLPQPKVEQSASETVPIGMERFEASGEGLIGLGTVSVTEPPQHARYRAGGQLVVEAVAQLAVAGGSADPVALKLSVHSIGVPGHHPTVTVDLDTDPERATKLAMPYPAAAGSVRHIHFGIAVDVVFARLGSVVGRVKGKVTVTWRLTHVRPDATTTDVGHGELAPSLVVEVVAVVVVGIDGVGKVSLPLVAGTGGERSMPNGISLRLGQRGPDAAAAIPETIGIELSHVLAHTGPTVEVAIFTRESPPFHDEPPGRTERLDLASPKKLRLPLRDLLSGSRALAAFAAPSEPAKPSVETAIVIRLSQLRPDGTMLGAAVVVPVTIEAPPPPLLICVDLGASATAAWFGPARSGLGVPDGRLLPLGALVHDLTGDRHEEFDPTRAPADNVLLPSLVGLDPTRSMRARFAPLSYGDAGLARRDDEGVARRLRALGRHYDVSVPFVPRQDIPASGDTIIREPKREMMRALEACGPCRRPILGREVLAQENGQVVATRMVDFGALLGDVFHELGDFLLPRALKLADGEPAQTGRRGATGDGPFVGAWVEGRYGIGAVATYPSGVPATVREGYRTSVERCLTAFTGAADSHAWIKLVPEAVAAAFFGIESLLAEGKQAEPGHKLFAALDIGAGTCDATLIDATLRHHPRSNKLHVAEWTIRSHFGMIVGGRDLDLAIEAAVRDVLAGLATREAFRGLEIAHDVRGPGSGAARGAGSTTLTQLFARDLAFRDAIQDAKRGLSAVLLARPASEAFRWSDDGPRFRVVVGREPDDGTLPVRRTEPTRRLEAPVGRPGTTVEVERRPVDGLDGVHLVIEGTCGDDGRVEAPRIVLEMGPSAFAARRTEADVRADGRLDPRAVVDLLGRVVPRLLAREADRQGLPAPQWIVSGRAALWPPLFEAIGETARSGGGRVPPRPFPPAQMKEAVLLGAMALAIDARLPLGDDVPKLLAVLDDVTAIADRRAGGIRKLSAIRYLDGSERLDGKANVTWHDSSRLVQILPGLIADPTTAAPDHDAITLLDLFEVPWQRELADRISPGAGDVEVAWSWRGDAPDIHIGNAAVRTAAAGRAT